ncbi:MAG TPA: S9 family peptidase [Pyrinomonadaceae bacterium]|nr:S9 family peptidase [Pyrinomonadaceae bacterium]
MFRQNYCKFLLISLFILSISVFAFTQSPNPSLLTIDRIFNSNDFSPQGVGGFRWLKSGNAYTKIEPSVTVKGGTDLVSYDVEKNTRTVLIPAEKLIPTNDSTPLRISGYEWSSDNQQMLIFTNTKRVWRLNTLGDYWVLNLVNGKLQKIGGEAKPSTLMFAKFSPDGKKVGYVRENNLYAENLADGKITQLTSDGSKTLINGTSDWVNEEELGLRDCWRWSPDNQSIAYWQMDSSGIKDFILINNTDELYPKLTYIPYPKAGTTNAAVRIGVVSANGGTTKWINTPGDLRNNYIAMMDWTDNSNELILQHLNRLQNTNQLMIADAKTGNVKTILTEKDEAWVDVEIQKMLWLEGGKSFLWMSERDGWQHVYKVSRDGLNIKLITVGNFDVVSIQSVDEANGWLYFIASPENATQRYLFRTKLEGSGTIEKITPESQNGVNSYNISPNSRWAFHTYSAFGKAPQYELVDVANKTLVKMMVDNISLQAKIDAIKKGPQEFFKIDIGDGVTLDGYMIKPPDFDTNKKYPILFHVYGEPASQTVMDSWGGTNYLWHSMLAQQGYIIASIDNRGTPAPKGRAWRKSIYRKIGILSSQDQANAVKAMIAKYSFIDAKRVGIWGWSGGGSSTLNAIFRYPDVYKMGMSVAPVPKMCFYDTIYQERYMGLPDANSEDYKQGSPISFAKNLTGDLLIVHGTGDDNVHYQGTETLINELIKENKQFTMMAYPNRSHGIFEGENTTRHLYTMLTKYLNEHLPVK